MKMQDVITALREEAPKLAKFHEETAGLYKKVWDLWDDFSRCESEDGRRLLVDAAREAMNRFSAAFIDMSVSIERIGQLNDGYTRKLGPKKPKDDPRQPDLPGLEDTDPDGGTTSCGQLADGPSWHTSRRHK